MSKAFTTDSDEGGELPEPPPLPPGTRNYMTTLGAARLKSDVDRLSRERLTLDESVEGKARLQTLDRQLRYLLPRLEALEEIDPLHQPKDRVLFGATVSISDGSGKKDTWRIVGLDEADLDRGWISWMSPLANALLEKRVGDVVPFMGRHLTILSITYHS